jgi:hypothetical protein
VGIQLPPQGGQGHRGVDAEGHRRRRFALERATGLESDTGHQVPNRFGAGLDRGGQITDRLGGLRDLLEPVTERLQSRLQPDELLGRPELIVQESPQPLKASAGS